MKRLNRRRTSKPAKQRTLRMEPLVNCLCLAASLGWDGPGLGAASLTDYIGDVPAGVGLEQAEVETALETALDAWAQVADLTFTQTTLARQSDSLDITFAPQQPTAGRCEQRPNGVGAGCLDDYQRLEQAWTTQPELEAIAQEHHRGDRFARFDANEDEALTVDEVPERLWNRLSRAGRNESGEVAQPLRSPSVEDQLHHARHRGSRSRNV